MVRHVDEMDSVAVDVVVEAQADCSDLDRARAALADALGGARAPSRGGRGPRRAQAAARATPPRDARWTLTMAVAPAPSRRAPKPGSRVTVVRPTAPTSPAQPAPSSVAAGRGVATSPPAEPAPSASSELAAPEVTSRPNTGAAAAPRAAATAAAEPGPAPRAKPVAIAEAPPRSDLSDEASLVTAARTALVAGDPARALLLVQSARKSKARSLEPEELSLEARALRALGRADEALATELALRGRYPAHALAR
jgi:hypothetical protein